MPNEHTRAYDKGERRYKHVGRGSTPEIQFVRGNPRMWVGKCPTSLSAEDHVRLINEAIAGSNGDRDISFPKKIYTVHEGAVYEGQTTDRGRSYHGYPFRGKLSATLLRRLHDIAVSKECENEFNQWVREHIEVHGA